MKIRYRGFEIEVKREKCLAGYNLLYYTVVRDDGYFLIDRFSYSADTVREMIGYLKQNVDDYIEHPEDWEDKEF